MNQIHLACGAIELGLYSCPLIREAWKTAGEGGVEWGMPMIDLETYPAQEG